MLSLINLTNLSNYDLVLIQEPYIYPNTQLTIASSKWYPMYPVTTNDQAYQLKSIILVNTIASSSIHQIPIPSPYITVISSILPAGNVKLYNLYNLPDSDLAHNDMQMWLCSHPLAHAMIWVGDFNKHHPIWTGLDHPARCLHSNTELLIHLITDYDMELALPTGTLIHRPEAHHT
jgi:hypothetical protein